MTIMKAMAIALPLALFAAFIVTNGYSGGF
jgi:hypothetical protein